MSYFINPNAFTGAVALPKSVADNHLKLASHNALKLIIYIMANGAEVPDSEICKALGMQVAELNEAVLYWKNAGVLTDGEVSVKAENEIAPAVKAVARVHQPSRAEIAKRASESKEITLVLRQAELKFCRPLKETEKRAVLYIIDDLGLSPAVTMMLIEFAVSENRTTASFLESTAVDWVNREINTVTLAENEIQKAIVKRSCWAIVRRAMGIDDRRATAKENEAAVRWVSEWGFKEAVLRLAYDQCVDSIGKFSVAYIDKVLKNWHQAGVATMADVEKAVAKSKPDKQDDAPSFDLSQF